MCDFGGGQGMRGHDRVGKGWVAAGAAAIMALSAGSAPPAALAQEGEQETMALDSLFRAWRIPLEMTEGHVRGEGFDWIVDQAADAQFVMVGESHLLKDVPLFTADLFEALAERHGFGYLVLENGPYAMEQLSAPGVRGDVEAAFGLANRYVNAIQFRADQEIELIARAGAASKARHDPVWGVDNAWGTLHLLEALVERAPDGSARRAAAALADSARRYEALRPESEAEPPRFINDVLEEADLDRLEAAFAGADAEARRLLGILRTGWEIYAMRSGGPAIYRANDRRERLMRSQTAAHLDAARAAGDTLPRAVLKLGQWHAMAGTLNWGDVVPFGTFTREVARRNGMEMLSIWTGLVNEPGHVWTLMDFEDYVPLARAGSTDRWWVVDLREIRPYAAAGRVELNEELRKVVFGFDLALLIGSGERATRERLEVH